MNKVKDKQRTDLQWVIEQTILESEFSVSRPSYHSSKYDGLPLRKFVKEAIEIFNKIQEFLL